MTLHAAVTRHHTAWVHCEDCRPHPVRYSVDGDRIVCFGDALPARATNGRRVVLAVHEIAGGPMLVEMNMTLRDAAADDLDANAIIELLDHISLGRTAEEVNDAIARHRARRLVTFS